MEISSDRVTKHINDGARTKTSILRPEYVSAKNNKSSSRDEPPKFVPLLPPFMQTEHQKFSPVETNFSRVSGETADRNVTQHANLARAKKITSRKSGAAILPYSDFRKGPAGEERSSLLSRSKKVASKSDASCKDKKVTSEGIREALPGSNYKTEYLAEMGEQNGYLESRDSDHREWNGDFQKDETGYQEWSYTEKGEAPWTSAHCECLLSNESYREDQNASNTTDPLLAHDLIVPYDRMPRARLQSAAGEDAEYITVVLFRRPRSPVRHILAGRFDLDARTEELLKQRNVAKTQRYLWKLKNRISRSVKQISDADVNFDLLICILVLRAICEQVISAMAGANIRTDIRAFINMAIIWAMVDLQILDPYTLDKEELAMFTELGLSDVSTRPESRGMDGTVGTSKLRRALFEARRPKFGPRGSAQLHRCLPWALLSPAHQRGVVKFYRNARERIDETLPLRPHEHVKSAYVPDLTCFHLRDVPDKAYVAYKRRSEVPPILNDGIDRVRNDELLAQLISFA